MAEGLPSKLTPTAGTITEPLDLKVKAEADHLTGLITEHPDWPYYTPEQRKESREAAVNEAKKIVASRNLAQKQLVDNYPVERVWPSAETQKEYVQPQDERVPSREEFESLLQQHPHLTVLELHRLGLLIYGVQVPLSYSHAPRQDGIVRGINLVIHRDEESLNDPSLDLDGRRLAVFQADPNKNLTPYRFDPESSTLTCLDEQVMAAKEFPRQKWSGPHYMRTNRNGEKTRLIVNPHPECKSGCKWCARTYTDRALTEELIGDILTPPQIIQSVLHDPEVMQGNSDLSHLEELNLITGDFPKFYPGSRGDGSAEIPLNVADYYVELIQEARKRGFKGAWYYAGHQIESEEDMKKLAALGSGTYVYTLEHIERRQQFLPSKGKRSFDDIVKILEKANSIFGKDKTHYYYIAGLDNPEVTKAGILRLKDIAIPQIHVFSPYTPNHDRLYFRETDRFARLRDVVELQEWILRMFQVPIPSGSNRGLFTPDVKLSDGKVTF